MKKLINSPETLVLEALDGMAAAHGDIIRVHKDGARAASGAAIRVREREA
jgi:dihydroxyacetone kinase-like protein